MSYSLSISIITDNRHSMILRRWKRSLDLLIRRVGHNGLCCRKAASAAAFLQLSLVCAQRVFYDFKQQRKGRDRNAHTRWNRQSWTKEAKPQWRQRRTRFFKSTCTSLDLSKINREICALEKIRVFLAGKMEQKTKEKEPKRSPKPTLSCPKHESSLKGTEMLSMSSLFLTHFINRFLKHSHLIFTFVGHLRDWTDELL